MNCPRHLPLAFMTLLTSAACSTSYQPKHNGRMHLVVQSGQLALQKDASTVRQDGPFSALAACDPESKAFADHAQQKIKSGNDLAMLSAVSYLLFGPGTAVGIVIAAIAQGEINQGTASMVDAVNRHNDTVSCTGRPS